MDPSGDSISQGGYRYAGLPDGAGSPELLVVVSFSGGGKRSAAFGYGVLKGLRDMKVSVGGRQHSLLDEVDIMTSVSGGSFVTAYYGLHRDKILHQLHGGFSLSRRRDLSLGHVSVALELGMDGQRGVRHQ